MGRRPDQWRSGQWQESYPYDAYDGGPYDGEVVLSPSSIYAPGVPIDRPPDEGFRGYGAAPGYDDGSAAAGYGPGYAEQGYPEQGYPEQGYAGPGYPYPEPGVPGYGAPGYGSAPAGVWGAPAPEDHRYPGDYPGANGPGTVLDYGVPAYTDDFGAGATGYGVGYDPAGYDPAGYGAAGYDPAGYADAQGQPAAPGYAAPGYGPQPAGGYAQPAGYSRYGDYEPAAGGYAPLPPEPAPAPPFPRGQPFRQAQPPPDTQSYSRAYPQAEPFPEAEPFPDARARLRARDIRLTQSAQPQPAQQLPPSPQPASREPSPSFAYHDDGDAAEPARPGGPARPGEPALPAALARPPEQEDYGPSLADWYEDPVTEEEERRRAAAEELASARGAFEPLPPPLERIKKLYLAAGADDGAGADADLARLMAMQKELISEYFELSEVDRSW